MSRYTTFIKEQTRNEKIAQLLSLTHTYADMAREGGGVSEIGGALHALIDEITSDVYGLEFAYCGREHSVV